MHMGDAPGIGTAADIKVGVTTITSGTTGRILYDNGGTLGEMTTTGSGTVVVLATGATLVTPALGVATATSLALGGATIGSNALAVTGASSISSTLDVGGSITSGGNIRATNAGYIFFNGRSAFSSAADGSITISTNDTTTTASILTAAGAAATPNLRLGAAAVDTAPVAQTLSVQNVLAGGTSNVAGAAFTIAGSQGKGTGVGGNIILQTAPAGSTGTVVNALATVATLYGSGDVGIGSGSAIATSATAGFLLIPTCAGTPTGAPPNAGTGKAALIFDTTNSQLWVSVSGATWKQPKTPAAAAVVNWQ